MKEIKYYKINETLSNKYYQIPHELFESSLYKNNLNSDSKILYAFLLDRLTLSQKNHWVDKEHRIYLIFTREEVQEKLNLDENTPHMHLAYIPVIHTQDKNGKSIDKICAFGKVKIVIEIYKMPTLNMYLQKVLN